METITTFHSKVLYYHFTPQEVHALYKLILYMGWIPHGEENEDMIAVVDHICKIVESNGMVTRDNKTT